MDKFIVGGLTVAIIIAIMAPYIASSDPDGLESAAEKIISPEVSDEPVLESPMPDYVLPSLGEEPISGVVAIIIGVLIVFALAFGLGYALKKKEA